jgi:CheY-like chemotaxis protein
VVLNHSRSLDSSLIKGNDANLLRFLYDIIFMDINLPDMLGSEAAKVMRQYEKEFSLTTHSNIVAVSVEGKKNVSMEGIFDHYRKFKIIHSRKTSKV